MSFSENLSEKILKKRDIKVSSLRAYILNLQKLLKLSGEDISISNLDTLLKDTDLIMDLLEDKKPSTKRNYLAAIIVYLSVDEKNKKLVETYRELMDKFAKENIELISDNKKTKSQEDKWTTINELRKVLKEYKRELDRKGSLKKNELTKKELDLLQKWVVGNLYIGDEENPPLRNDYIMKVVTSSQYNTLSEKQREETNYLIVKNKSNKTFSLGNYKTKDKYGIKEIKVGKSLNKVLNIWLKYNKTDNLLLNSKGESMTANGLTKYLTKVFSPTGKNISSSIIRSIYITEAFPPETEEKKELADLMLHSKEVQGSVYAKE